MRLAAVLEHRFAVNRDGSLWTPDAYSYEYWRTFHTSFSEVSIVARALPATSVESHWLRADGPGVSVHRIPYYVGRWNFSKKPEVSGSLRAGLESADAALLRTPGALSNLSFPLVLSLRRPFGVHVVGDPYEVFSRSGIGGALRLPYRHWFVSSLRRQCQRAAVSMYVTADVLQRVPSRSRGFRHAMLRRQPHT